ncbi:hypothetical protein FACS1894217_15250 [Clostridia bacterium]|nr:hypothetical protein FACS1894217_15250 [Clostridia bacterium]
MLITKDGTRQNFNRSKILEGMIRACYKLPVPVERLEKQAVEIEQTLLNRLEREVSTAQVGNLVMSKLKDIDQVAYVRFAAVYRNFRDVEDFREELKNLLGE